MDTRALASDLAGKIRRWKLTTPAIFFLEGNRPFHFVFSQALVLLEPLAGLVVAGNRWRAIAEFFEEDANLELLLEALETGGTASPPQIE